MGKLVRDRIPEIMRQAGVEPEYRTMDAAEYWQSLIDKLIEEGEELRRAAPDEQLGELADVLEVFLALANFTGRTKAEIEQAAERKRVERGGFADRLWLERW